MKVNTDHVWPIILHSFLEEKYFFVFTDGVTRRIETYTEKEKSEWFRHLQTYYTRA